ncbi:MAG: pyrroline-5-carboxylate reductase [Deltaproteobacteria bacterium]|nr:pyrroline-5-carboxylate reductase [Deltaproteobacteria bacterium]
MLEKKKIALLGGGNMGEAVISGLLSASLSLPENIVVSEPREDRRRFLEQTYGVTTGNTNADVVKGRDIILLTVKPQDMGTVLREISPHVTAASLVISVAAGIPLRFIEEHLQQNIPVIRVMPNMPALIGAGAAALAVGTHASEKNLAVAGQIFDSLGVTVVVDETMLDTVTGLSGSGPAYAFKMIEALVDAGVKLGLPHDIATLLTAQTILGAARLCLESGKSPAQLTDLITSPGGTTIAGLAVLEKGDFRSTVMGAVEAAAARSRELGKVSP